MEHLPPQQADYYDLTEAQIGHKKDSKMRIVSGDLLCAFFYAALTLTKTFFAPEKSSYNNEVFKNLV